MAMKEEDNEIPKGVRTIAKWIFGGLAVIILLTIVSWTIVPIGAGNRGVLTQFGKPIGVFDSGLNFKAPVIQGVIVMSIQTLKYEAHASAASKDLQDVSTAVALNYHLDGSKVMELYTNVGTNDIIEATLIQPAVQESVKATTAEFNAEELITERPLVKGRIDDVLRLRLGERGIFVETISITDFKFSPDFTAAIEAKQVAQQNALKAENDLNRIKVEAQQVVAKAQGDANGTLTKAYAEALAIKVQGDALKENQQVVTLRQIEKWNGILPNVMTGGNSPFIFDLSKVQ
jgi:regulator of protease activity HflC (stomatin/prohibitin superfamily)